MTTIQSVDLAPQKHADRVVAQILRELAEQRAMVVYAIGMALFKSKDGGPRAQSRLADRIRRAGAVHVELTPGKRGKYQLIIHEVTGWNPVTDQEIRFDDPMPDKPWLAYVLSVIDNRGRSLHSKSLLFITHHSLSRAAQRFNLKTAEHMMTLAQKIWITLNERISDDASLEKLLNPPPQGHRISLGNGCIVILQRHEKRDALVAATFIEED